MTIVATKHNCFTDFTLKLGHAIDWNKNYHVQHNMVLLEGKLWANRLSGSGLTI